MDAASFQRWLDDYVDAWRSYDPEAIGALFAEAATYRYHPWDEDDDVVRGRAAIVADWLADPDEPGSWSAEYRPWLVSGDDAVALGVSRYLNRDGAVDREYHNAFLCRFDGDGRCREFTDVYLRRD